MRWRVGLLSALDYPMMGHIIRALLQRGVPIDAVILDAKGFGENAQKIHDERTAGRLPPVPVDDFEDERLPYYFVKTHSSVACAELVKTLDLDILVNAGTPRILTSLILTAPKIGVLSCHPGLIPQFRGCTNVEWAIFHDEPVANTVFYMGTEIDRGPIVLKEIVEIFKVDRYEDIRVRTQTAGFDVLARAIAAILRDYIRPSDLPMPDEGRYFSVIGAKEMSTVREKLIRGAYLYQTK